MRTANEYISLGHAREGETHLNQSLLIAKKHRLPSQSQILRSMCFFKIRTGDLGQAFEAAREATLQAERCGDTHGIAKGLAMMARVKGESSTSRTYPNEAEFRHMRIGYRRGWRRYETCDIGARATRSHDRRARLPRGCRSL